MSRYKPAQERRFRDPDVEVPRESIPEAKLWIAVIDQAREDLLSPTQRKAATLWLVSEKSEPGSFRWACDYLDLDVRAVRAALNCHRELIG